MGCQSAKEEELEINLSSNSLIIDPAVNKERSEINIPFNSVIFDSPMNKEKSRISLTSNSVTINSPLISTSPTLLAWSSSKNNKISIIDLETKQNYVTFDGARINDPGRSWTHLTEILNSKLLVSLHHNYGKSANMEIFDISKKGRANKIYSLGEVSGITGWGDVTYNSRRSILGAIPVTGRIAYHLLTIDTHASNTDGIVKLSRKSKWHSQYSTEEDNCITGLDFNTVGEFVATIDAYGVCLISDVNTNNYVFHLRVGINADTVSRCRWSTNTGEPFLFAKYNENGLNILDVEKKARIFRNPFKLDNSTYVPAKFCFAFFHLLLFIFINF